MHKKIIKQMARKSFTAKVLDTKKIEQFLPYFKTRLELKNYIRELKAATARQTVYIALPTAKVYNEDREFLTQVFQNKQLVFSRQPALMLGINIVDNDLVYELSLQDKLDKLLTYLKEDYE